MVAAAAALDLSDYPALAAEQEIRPATMEVSLREGLLSANIREAPVAAVLNAIGEEAGFRVVIRGDLDVPISWSFAEVSLEKALRRLLQNTNSALLYDSRRGGGTIRLVKVIAWPGHGDAADYAARVARKIRSDRSPLGGPNDDLYARLGAVRKLAEQPHANAAEDLALALFEDEDPVVRRIAATGLGKIGGEPALAGLTAALYDEDNWVRRRAILGLRHIGGDSAVWALGETLRDDPNPEVRQAAANTLGWMGSEEAFGALESAQSDLDFAVRHAVAAAIARLEDM